MPLIEAVNMSVAKWGRDGGDCGVSNNDILHAAICRVVAADHDTSAAAQSRATEDRRDRDRVA